MKYSVLILVTFIVIVFKYDETAALTAVTMNDLRNQISVDDPGWGTLSSGILKSHSGISYSSNFKKTLILSAPTGCGILASIRLLDFRPRKQDNVTLFVVNQSWTTVTYSNTFSIRDYSNDPYELKTFTASNGQLGVTFQTSYGSTYGYEGFELTYTAYKNGICKWDNYECINRRCIAKTLKCDGHNHCGDRSDQTSCPHPYPRKVNSVGIICGVIFLLIAVACGIFITIRKATRSRSEVQTVVTHPPPTCPPGYPSTYPQPGTYYPPPPPPYTQYPQGQVNPGYR